jgi:ribonuclease HII
MKTIVGIDEVGRGPLAGPVTVCVVSCDIKKYSKLKKDKNLPAFGKDSKKLSPFEREKYSKNLSISGISFIVTHISNKIIDENGISFAIRKAILTGIKKLNLDPKSCEILLDGSLKAPSEFKQKTIIKGDEKEKIIAWASILAKVSRDSLLVKLGKKYPKYGFEVHKGYGTARHRTAIERFGLLPVHRLTFCRKD